MPIQKIAVLGAGNGGCAAAADLTLRGFQVRLFARSESTIAKLAKLGEIELVESGVSEKSVKYKACLRTSSLQRTFWKPFTPTSTQSCIQPVCSATPVGLKRPVAIFFTIAKALRRRSALGSMRSTGSGSKSSGRSALRRLVSSIYSTALD